MPVGVAVLDRGLVVTHANAAFVRLLGVAPDGVVGQPLATLLPGLGDAGAARLTEVATGATLAAELELRVGSGSATDVERSFVATARPLVAQGGVGERARAHARRGDRRAAPLAVRRGAPGARLGPRRGGDRGGRGGDRARRGARDARGGPRRGLAGDRRRLASRRRRLARLSGWRAHAAASPPGDRRGRPAGGGQPDGGGPRVRHRRGGPRTLPALRATPGGRRRPGRGRDARRTGADGRDHPRLAAGARDRRRRPGVPRGVQPARRPGPGPGPHRDPRAPPVRERGRDPRRDRRRARAGVDRADAAAGRDAGRRGAVGRRARARRGRRRRPRSSRARATAARPPRRPSCRSTRPSRRSRRSAKAARC